MFEPAEPVFAASALSSIAVVVGVIVAIVIPARAYWRRSRHEDTERSRRGVRRQQLIDRKHATMSEIRSLQSEIRSLSERGSDVSSRQQRLDRLQAEHYRLRMEIDRSRP